MKILLWVFQCLLLLGGGLLLSHCQSTTKPGAQAQGALLAQVQTYKLYARQVQEIMPAGLPPADSTQWVERYTNQWVRNRLIMLKAQKMGNLDEAEIEQKVQNYREELIAHEFEKQYLRDKLKENLRPQEIETYYQQNPENFRLKEDLVGFIFLRIPASSPDQNLLPAWIASNKSEDAQKLKEYCAKFAKSFQIAPQEWTPTNKAIRRAGLNPSEALMVYLQVGQLLVQTQADQVVYWQVKQLKKVGELAPLAYVAPAIRELLLNQRKVKLIQELEEETYKEAQKKQLFKIFVHEKPSYRPSPLAGLLGSSAHLCPGGHYFG
ncbi:MAG: hypothetical protein HC913_03080 [Microscillaceae bacterium]|nr:hypothetical protein [Microscillaceae bacterium]